MKARHLSLENELSNRLENGTSALAAESLLTHPRSFGRTLTPPTRPQLKIVIFGPSLTTSLGDGAASTYRGLVRELSVRGHEVLFLQRGHENGDGQTVRKLDSGRLERYAGLKQLKNIHAAAVRDADFVLVASQIPDTAEVGRWVLGHAQGVTAFYDMATPQTVASLSQNGVRSLSAELIARYDLYLSSVGGPLLEHLEDDFGIRMARPLYPAADARLFFPEYSKQSWDLGYLGRYRDDCLPALERLLIEPARRWKDGCFLLAGSAYPRSARWHNVKRIPQVPPQKRRAFYNSQRFTLDVVTPIVAGVGYSPSARLFEAAACGTPVISEFWQGLDTFFTPDEEILISHSADETLIYLEEISELDRRRLGYRARERVLARHTSRHRAAELEGYVLELLRRSAS